MTDQQVSRQHNEGRQNEEQELIARLNGETAKLIGTTCKLTMPPAMSWALPQPPI